jgi:hypothetical protein
MPLPVDRAVKPNQASTAARRREPPLSSGRAGAGRRSAGAQRGQETLTLKGSSGGVTLDVGGVRLAAGTSAR